MEMKKATFGGGCFWQIEDAFRKVDGVFDAVSGYMGGELPDPTYGEVCTDRTGHAEVVQVSYHPEVVTYEELVDVFWRLHDPTQLNRQGPDVGTQYRSAIFFHDPEQRAAAKASRDTLQERSRRPIVTEIRGATEFWPAEDYHQRYLERTGEVCHVPPGLTWLD